MIRALRHWLSAPEPSATDIAARDLDDRLAKRRVIRRAESARARTAYWTNRTRELREAREMFERGNPA